MKQGKERSEDDQRLSSHGVSSRDFVYEPRTTVNPTTTKTAAKSTPASLVESGSCASLTLPERTRASSHTASTTHHRSRPSRHRPRIPQARASQTSLCLQTAGYDVPTSARSSEDERRKAKKSCGVAVISASEKATDRMRRAYLREVAMRTASYPTIPEDINEDVDPSRSEP